MILRTILPSATAVSTACEKVTRWRTEHRPPLLTTSNSMKLRSSKLEFVFEVLVESLSDVPRLQGFIQCKLRLLGSGAPLRKPFRGESHKVCTPMTKIENHQVNFNLHPVIFTIRLYLIIEEKSTQRVLFFYVCLPIAQDLDRFDFENFMLPNYSQFASETVGF